MKAIIVGGSAPFREALAGRLEGRGLEIADPLSDVGERGVAIVHCDEKDRWEDLAKFSEDPDLVVVAVIQSIELDLYIRALTAGASGVVYVDTPTSIMADATPPFRVK